MTITVRLFTANRYIPTREDSGSFLDGTLSRRRGAGVLCYNLTVVESNCTAAVQPLISCSV